MAGSGGKGSACVCLCMHELVHGEEVFEAESTLKYL